MLTSEYSAISHYLSLNDGWDITINEERFQNISLDAFRFPPVSKGDTLTMERTFAADTDCTGHALLLQIKQSAVTVSIDGEEIYQYGWDRIERNKTVGSGYLPVDLPDDYAGKKLTMQFTVAEDKAFSRIEPVCIHEWKNIYRTILTENRVPLFLGCFLTIFGLVACCITLIAMMFSGKYSRILCVSLFSVCIGMWSLCYYNVFLIFSMPLHDEPAGIYHAVSDAHPPAPLYAGGCAYSEPSFDVYDLQNTVHDAGLCDLSFSGFTRWILCTVPPH